MKIVVIGGTDLIGSKSVPILRQGGHEVVAASPNTGVNTITGEGLKEAVAGAQRGTNFRYWPRSGRSTGTVSTSGPRRESMTLSKDAKGLGMPWEDLYGYAQAVRVGDTIYVSGQLSHDDEGNIVGPAPLDEKGEILDHSNMETQMRQTYANAEKILGRYGATLQNVVEEVLYVTDMNAAFSAAGPVRKKAYGSERPAVASTIVTTSRLALPTQLIEIKFTARV